MARAQSFLENQARPPARRAAHVDPAEGGPPGEEGSHAPLFNGQAQGLGARGPEGGEVDEWGLLQRFVFFF